MVDISLVFRVINIVVAVFMIIGAVATIIDGGFPNFIQGIFCILLGLMTAVFEFKLPGQVTQFASFMFSFLGRGIFYIFVGGITLGYKGLAIASGVIILVVGVGFVICHFIRTIDPPSNMQQVAFDESIGHTTRLQGSHMESGIPAPEATHKTLITDGHTI
ncbi:COPI associated protein-domain-containing protein [Phycomyces nitens]|nr:COPI associated protein-domain-containing protein [Phycomyces nitens]